MTKPSRRGQNLWIDSEDDFIGAAEWLVKEANLPENVTPANSKLKDPEERHRLATVFNRGLTEPSGFILPVLA